MTRVALEGRALHGGAPVRVTLSRAEGPVALVRDGVGCAVAELEPVAGERATWVRGPGGAPEVATVEHLFSALAGLSIHEGVRIEVEGAELPVLDGGARAWVDALLALDPPRGRPRLRVARAATIDVARSRYVFEVAPTPFVEVDADFADPRLEPRAAWSGDESVYVASIARARTFAFAADVPELAARGLGRGVDPESVVVIAKDAILSAGPPFSPDEPARHKLLDLLGDLYVRGGPPVGRVIARRPGHAATHAAIARALAEGVLASAEQEREAEDR